MEYARQARYEFLIDYIRHGSTIFGYGIPSRTGYFSPTLLSRFHAPDTVEDLPNWMLQAGNVAPENTQEWLKLFAELDNGAQSSFAMVSLLSEDGSFGRYWLRADVSTDEHGQHFFAVITVDDFTELSRQFHSQTDNNKVLLYAARAYPEIISINLTRGTYRLVRYDTNSLCHLPESGPFLHMVQIRGSQVYAEDQENYFSCFSMERLETVFRQEDNAVVQLAYRRPMTDGTLCWMETTVSCQNNTPGEELILVSLSRNIDQQKGEELRLREQLRLQKEELRVTAAKLHQTICYYDVPTRTLTVPSSYAAAHSMPEVIPNYPDNLHRAEMEYYPEVPDILRNFCNAMIQGEPTGSCEVPFLIPGQGTLWEKMEYSMVYDQDGTPRRAVIFLMDVTDQHIQREENQQLREQMQETRQIFQIVAQHSNRILYLYDVASGITRPWDAENQKRDILAHLYTGQYSDSKLYQNPHVLPDSRENMKQFFRSIHDGIPSGSANFHIRTPEGQVNWYRFQYSLLFYHGSPSSALISVRDITERHEYELAYLRHVQSIELNSDGYFMYIESDLTANQIEKCAGLTLTEADRRISCSHSDFGHLLLEQKFRYVEAEQAARYFSGQHLMELYASGERQQKTEWQVQLPDGSSRWLSTKVTLMEDPYNRHIRSFIRMRDITKKKRKQLEIRHRSERDSMTGLYNRATAEAHTRHLMQNSSPGILLLLDLDDLKGINDTFGHGAGDRALLGITQTLKSHFRDSDVLGRLGGDEFLIYLPGAADSSDAISISLTSMLRRLSVISIGESEARHIHCSIGCAIQRSPDDTFEQLFKQADTALYHVKRSGKNNFAFYQTEMEQEDYQFRSNQLLSHQSIRKFDLSELQYLLSSIASLYQMIYSANLSTNNYYLMENNEDESKFKQPLPTFGSLDQLTELFLDSVHPDDQKVFIQTLSRPALLLAYQQNIKNVRHYYRYYYQNQYRWAESMVLFYTNERGDVCNSTLTRWADERAQELDRYSVLSGSGTASESLFPK